MLQIYSRKEATPPVHRYFVRWRGWRTIRLRSPRCFVDDRVRVELCVLNDRLESLDGLLEIFDVPVIVVGGTGEEA